MEEWTLEEAFLLEEKLNTLSDEELMGLFNALKLNINSANIRHEVIRLFDEVPKSSLILELKNFGINIS